jgi:uncharacterized membrane protein
MVLAIAIGGSFVLTQLVLWLVFRDHLAIGAWCGVALIFAGILLVGLCRDAPAR